MDFLGFQLRNNLFVAPMAGVTDRPFRQLCKKLGAGLAVSEMVTSNSLLYGSAKTRRRANHDGEVEPISVQIAGADPRMMAEAAKYNVDEGAQIVDINMRPFSHLIILRLTTLGVALLLAGCEIPGMGPDPKIAARLADGKAIGSACRHALRGIEDCYALNEKALKTAVFEGWKEMDQYMRDNCDFDVPTTSPSRSAISSCVHPSTS